MSSIPPDSPSLNNATAQPFRLSDYHYELPPSLIAQSPLASRSDSRLLELSGNSIRHLAVRNLADLLSPGDHLVFNNTRVIPARLFGEKQTGGKIELMVERLSGNNHLLAKIRSSKSPKTGSKIYLYTRSTRAALDGLGDNVDLRSQDSLRLTIVGREHDLFELVADDCQEGALASFIERHGDIPLPPYIERKPDDDDLERYQTLFADRPGAVAAPTAGLHFDEELMQSLAEKEVTHSFITLHVGAGTFQPVRVDDPADHVMHAERVSVEAETVSAIESVRAQGNRIIAVGTTSVRALEAAAQSTGQIQTFEGDTRLFLTPGAKFHVVDAMFTNFHLPESTLLMLVAAFAGLNETLSAYREAVEQQYRFFSYGDAMLVWPKHGVPV